MQPIEPPNTFHLQAAQGWFELGNPLEAGLELDQLTPATQSHPEVLGLRWHIAAHARDWPAGVQIAERLVQSAPENADNWVHRSYALHEMKRTREAFDQLLPAATRFPDRWIIPYNLACYCAQLDRLVESRSWFVKALELDLDATKTAAANDPDLQPLRDSLGGNIA